MRALILTAGCSFALAALGAAPAWAGCSDGDGDGFEPPGCALPADCDDSDPTVYPGAPEACDDVDSDCDGLDDAEDVDVGAVPGPTIIDGNTPFVNIQDNATITDSVVVTGAFGPVTDVDVTVQLFPDIASDLVVTLISPDGVSVELISATGGFGDQFNGTTLDDESSNDLSTGAPDWNGTYRPVGDLSDFDYGSANGTWTLAVQDAVLNFADGIFNQWTIDLETLDVDDDDLDGWVECGDCDDADGTVNPDALEVCNDGVDQDCDGEDTDGDFDGDGVEDDADGDGSGFCSDCDDGDDTVAPGAPETCDDGIDQDCDGSDLLGDEDGDGVDNAACGGDDCDDADPNAYPGLDADGDGSDSCDDCDDGEPLRSPDLPEDCGDGLDNDCDGEFDGNDPDCGGDDDDSGDDDDAADDDDATDDDAADDDDDSGAGDGAGDDCESSFAGSAAPAAVALLLPAAAARRRRR